MTGGLRHSLIEELPVSLSPVRLFELFRSEPFSFFLDSAMDPARLGRYSLMGSAPFLRLISRGDSVIVTQGNSEITVKGNPLDILGHYLETYRLDSRDPRVPCASGAVGYLSYDLGHFVESLPCRAVDDLDLPESCFGFYDVMLVFDNLLSRTYLISTGFPEVDETRRSARARERLEEYKYRLAALPVETAAAKEIESAAGEIIFKSNFTHADYIRAVERARQYIIDGDIFEVNLSQRYEADIAIPPYELYRRLRRLNPAPFAAYLDCGEVVVAGSSPERFLRLQGDMVEARPSRAPPAGAVLRRKMPPMPAVCSKVKKTARENMMIVDLERNDLGRVCRYGSVKVTELAVLETYPTVFHLTSTIEGRLREGVSRIDLLKATFPGGSITGAPKVRSMEIIDELEPTRRSLYTGSLGYLGFDGNLDLNIVIRTFLIKGRRAYFQVGGAVVYDSDAESEYQETLDKGKALFNALSKEVI